MTSEQDWDEIRQGRAQMLADVAAEPFVEVARVSDVDAGGVTCRVYEPDVVPSAGTIVYAHGGGFSFGSRHTHDPIGRRLAATAGWTVVLVDYRLAPEAPFPAAYDDCLTALDWVRHSDLPRPLVVAGDSAGGNLALGMALARPDAIAGQVLVYPFLDPSCDSYDRDLPDSAEQLEEYAWYWPLYLPPGAEDDVRADPLLAESYAGLPPALVQLASLDALTPTGKQVADRLAADGVPTTAQLFDDVGHGFWRRAEHEQSQQALDRIREFVSALR